MRIFESLIGKGRERREPSPDVLLDKAVRLQTLTMQERSELIKHGYGHHLKKIDKARREEHRKANTH